MLIINHCFFVFFHYCIIIEEEKKEVKSKKFAIHIKNVAEQVLYCVVKWNVNLATQTHKKVIPVQYFKAVP